MEKRLAELEIRAAFQEQTIHELNGVVTRQQNQIDRMLQELELWEVSLVTFPMLPEARVGSKSDPLTRDLTDLADLFHQAREELARR